MGRVIALMAAIGLLVSFVNATTTVTDLREGVLVAAGPGGLTMTDVYGENMRSYLIAPNVRITRDGMLAKLEDLRMGDHLAVTLRRQDRQTEVVIRINAHAP